MIWSNVQIYDNQNLHCYIIMFADIWCFMMRILCDDGLLFLIMYVFRYWRMMNSCTRCYVEWCMMMIPSLTWHGVSPAKWTELKCHLIHPAKLETFDGRFQTIQSYICNYIYRCAWYCIVMLCQSTVDLKVSIITPSRIAYVLSLS